MDNRVLRNLKHLMFVLKHLLIYYKYILQSLSCLHKAKMFRLAFILTLLVISIVNLWALNCKECKGESPLGDKKDCWEGKDGVDQGKRDTCSVLLISVIVKKLSLNLDK